MTRDVAIIGLGAAGSAAAYHASKAGLTVVGFDRHSPPHTLGSTHGGSRIIRSAYFEGEVYLPLLERAYVCWRELEEDLGTNLLHLHGALTVGRREGGVLEGAASTARKGGVPHRLLGPEETTDAFPAFTLRDGEAALFEPEAGWIDPEAAVRSHLDAARRFGAELLTDEPVLAWEVEGGGVVVETVRTRVHAGALIVCAGGWTNELLPDLGLPLTLERQVNVWYRPARRARHLQPEHCPVYVWEYDRDRVLYGFPDLGDGVKAGLHHRGEPAHHPDELNREVHSDDIHPLTHALRRLLPDACGEIARAAVCFYTNTPDERFVIDEHPRHPNVLFASACSGHGFKFSSAVGENVARLAAGTQPTVDLRPYRADRYH